MAQLFNHKQSFRWQPAVFEMKDYIAIAGQVYDKSTLAPIPFRNIDINSYSKSQMVGKTTWVYEASDGVWEGAGSAQVHGGQVGPNQFVVDDSDSSVGYVICPRDDGVTLRAHKINLNDHSILVTGATSLGSSTDSYNAYNDYPNSCYIIAQDANYLYYIHKHRNQRNSERYVMENTGDTCLGWISKSTMQQAGEADFMRKRNAVYLGQKGTMLFWAISGIYYNTTYVDSDQGVRVYKFDMATKTGTQLVQMNLTETFNSFGWVSRPFDAGNDIIYGYYAGRSDDALEGYRLYKVEVNMLAETATVTEVTYNFGATDRGATLVRHDVNSDNHKVVTFTSDDGSNKYVHFCVTERVGINSITLNAFKIHTFMVDSGDRSNLIYKSTASPGFRMRGIMPLKDDYTKFMIIGDSHCETWDWNSSNEEYNYTSTINLQCRGAMVDSLNRLWVYDDGNNVHLLSNFSPVTITVTPELESYNYQGSDISTYINVSAWDIDNARLATNVRIVLEGSTYFTDNSQIKTITTSAAAETQVNIKVTGTSYTRVLTSVVV